MTKDQYYAMCEMLGTIPKEEEVPVEYDDLFTDLHEALNIYYRLRDEWDSNSGIYLGKRFAGVTEIFDLYEVPPEDRRVMFDLLNTIDACRTKTLNAKKK